MKELFNSLKRHQFFTLSAGVVSAQLLSLACIPVLTRIYPVEGFGYFAVYAAIATIIGVFSTLRLEMAVPIAEDQPEADQMSALCLAMALSVGAFLLMIFAVPQVRELFPSMDQRFGTWALIAVAAVLVAWVQVITQRVLRNGRLKYISIRHIVEKSLFLGVAFLAAHLEFTFTGLIIGQTVGSFGSVVVLFLGSAWRPRLDTASITRLFKKYSDFPKFNSLSMALQLGSNQLPTLIYSNLFPVQGLGFLNLAQRVADAPSTIVTSALAAVFYRRVIDAPRDAYRRIFLRGLLWCFLVFALPAVVVSLYAEPLLRFVFGEPWAAAAPYFVALIPLTVARLSFTLQQGILIVMRRLDIDLRISGMVLGAQIAGMIAGIYLTDDLLGPVMLASIFSAIVYAYSLVMIYQLVNQKPVSQL